MIFIRDHWRLCAELVLLMALAGTSWAAFHRQPPPAVHEVVQDHAADDKKAAVETHTDEGAWTKTTYGFALPAGECAPAGASTTTSVAPAGPATEQLTSIIVERHDPTVIESHSQTEEHLVQDHHLDLTITPQALPGWGLQVGFEDVLQARTLRVAARRRLFGPIWLEVSAVPAMRSLGVAAAVEF